MFGYMNKMFSTHDILICSLYGVNALSPGLVPQKSVHRHLKYSCRNALLPSRTRMRDKMVVKAVGGEDAPEALHAWNWGGGIVEVPLFSPLSLVPACFVSQENASSARSSSHQPARIWRLGCGLIF